MQPRRRPPAGLSDVRRDSTSPSLPPFDPAITLSTLSGLADFVHSRPSGGELPAYPSLSGRRTVALCGAAAAGAAALAAAGGWWAGLGVGGLALAGLGAAAAAVGGAAAAGLPLWRASQARALAEEAARRHLATWLSATAHGHIDLDARGRVVASGARGGTDVFAGRAPERGRSLWSQASLHLQPEQIRRLRRAVHAHEGWPEIELEWTGNDGATRPVGLSGVPRHGPDGRFAGHWVLVRDRTAEVHARDALRATETRYHDLFRRIPLPLVLHRSGVVLDANPAAVALFGYSDLNAMVGDNVLAWYEQGDERERARTRLQQVQSMPLGQPLPATEYRIRPPSGGELLVQVSSAPVEVDDGRATLSIYTDETERRASEQAVRRSEALLSHLVKTSPDAITLTEMSTGRYQMVNPTFERITGYAAHEVIGRTAGEIAIWVHTAERDRLVQALQRDGTVQNLPCTFRSRDGAQVLMLLSAARFEMGGSDYLVIAARDVTATEQARLEREAILQNALMGIALTRDERFILVNPRFEQMLGWPAGLLVGQHASLVFPSPADHQAVGREVGPVLSQGEQIEIERPLMRRDGSIFLCRLLAKSLSPTEPVRGGTIWLAEDVTEKRQVEQALAKARDEAEAASRAKSAFLANTSHEIRTPLNALLGLARLARQPGVDESRRRQYIEQISDSAETLSGILSDILDLSKIEAGKMHLDHEPFDLHGLLRAMHQAYGSLADTKGLTMSIELDDDLPPVVVGDPVRVRQILSNFLNNALKFTESGGIRLSVRRGRGHRLRFEVTDTGPGIDEAQQAALFRPFSQVDVSRARRVGGTGLGLSICRQLADKMGGEVGVVSVVGQGSCFWAELPLPAGDADALDSTSSGFGADPISGSRVLMVEDNAVNMMIAVALLEQWGVDVAQAGDGHEAIEAVARAEASRRPFDVILMDVQMPGMSGHEATRLLRELHPKERLPIIALTAAALVSERDLALAAGMNDFLTKPIDAARLRNTLARALRTRDHA